MGLGGYHHAPAALSPGKRHGTHFIGSGLAPGPVRTNAENLAPTGIRSPDLQLVVQEYGLCFIDELG